MAERALIQSRRFGVSEYWHDTLNVASIHNKLVLRITGDHHSEDSDDHRGPDKGDPHGGPAPYDLTVLTRMDGGEWCRVAELEQSTEELHVFEHIFDEVKLVFEPTKRNVYSVYAQSKK